MSEVLRLLQYIIWHVCYALEWMLSGFRKPGYEVTDWALGAEVAI